MTVRTVGSLIDARQLTPSLAQPGSAITEVQFALLSRLADSDYPCGARLLRQYLASLGFEMSEATVSRVMLELDSAGLAWRAGTKGRVITDEGRHLVRSIRQSRCRDDEISRALDINTLEQVLDLLHARRAVEGEAARATAKRITDLQLSELQGLLGQQREHVRRGTVGRDCAITFHRSVMLYSGNALLISLGNIVLSDQLDYLEGSLDVVAATLGRTAESPHEHEAILKALSSRDAEGAERAMRSHLNRLIQDLEAFLAMRGEEPFANSWLA